MKELAIFIGDSNPEIANSMVKEIASTIGMGTIVPAQGVWNGEMEHSYMLITSEDEFNKHRGEIIKILKRYGQEALFLLYVGEGYLLYTHAEEEVVV